MPRRHLVAGAAGAATLCVAAGAASAQQVPAPAAPTADALTLPEVTVSAPRVSVRGYLVPESSTALKVPAPIQDVPVSVQVVPGSLIQDRQALTINQAVETVSGVERSLTFPNSLSFRVRGFVDSSTTLRDGFREQTGTQDIQGVERIEVLKGPASVLYGGALSSGGTVNVVTKRPTDGSFVRAGLTGGSFGLFRGTVDANRDVTGDGRLVVRLNGAYERSDTFRDFGDNEVTFFAPTLRWRPTEQDQVNLFASYQHTNFTWSQSQTPLLRQALGLPLSRNYAGPNLSESHQDSWRLGYDWVHTFDGGLRFRSGFNASVNNYDFGSDRLSAFTLRPDGRTLTRQVSRGPNVGQDFDSQNELSGTAYTGPVRHDWLVGGELQRTSFTAKTSTATLPTLDILNPSYGGAPGPFRVSSEVSTVAEGAGAYVQDFVTLLPQLRLLAGGRYDVTRNLGVNEMTRVRTPSSANQFSPRVGLVVEPVPSTALYFNWANSFIPTTSATAAGMALPPSSSEQFEVGVKQQLLAGRVQGTVALFQVTRSNVPTLDPANPLFSVATGEQRSRGVEVDVAGEVRPGWNLVASYAYTFATVTKDNRLRPGDLLAGVAKHAGQLWTTYEFQEGSVLPGFGLGIGVRAETKREAALPNTFKLPGYVRLDAAAWYRFTVRDRPLRAQLNVQNITDARIYDTNGVFSLRPQPPLSVLGTISAEF